MSLLDTASLIVTPNGYKEGKLYSVIPSDGSGDMSVTRATTATRVNSAGLVELVPYNLVQNSETTWTPTGVTITTGITDPNGGTNAYRISDIATGNVTEYAYKASTGINLASGTTITFSIYMKGSGTIATYMERTVGSGYWFDSELHTLSSDWQRFTQTYTITADTTGIAIYVGNLTGSTATSVDIAFPQLVEGSTAKDYQKTETRLNIPRLDYSNGTCPSLLVEPQRTNGLTYSSSFDDASWLKLNASVTSNNTISPSGIQDADKIVEDTSYNQHLVYRAIVGTSNTFSFYAKAAGRDWVSVLSNSGFHTFFNIANGTLGTIAATSTATIEDAGNGWYRCSVYNTHGTFGASVYLSTGNNVFEYTGNGTSGAYIWGAQLEAGNYSTSYIPTTSASVTRNADVISKTGISSLIGQTEGTMFVDFVYNAKYGSSPNGAMPISIDDGTVNNEAYIFLQGINNTAYAQFVVSGAFTCNITGLVMTIGTRYKMAFAYKQNDFAFYINGALQGTDTSGNIAALSNVRLCNYSALNYIHDNLYSAALWQTRLTNTQLAELTTL